MITPVKAVLVQMDGPPDGWPQHVHFNDVLVLDGVAKDVFLSIEGDLSLQNAEAIRAFLDDLIKAMRDYEIERNMRWKKLGESFLAVGKAVQEWSKSMRETSARIDCQEDRANDTTTPREESDRQ
ncbi:MAG: hypothetical protein PHH09_04000 [Methanoregulaceae archaeon]|nr:hypothetical protein [Methanoregulaceae archaeon]